MSDVADAAVNDAAERKLAADIRAASKDNFDRNAYGTPEYILQAVRESFGTPSGAMREIDMDPASNAKAQERVRAKCWFGEGSPFGADGLSFVWHGRVFLNPPYGKGLILPFAKHLAGNDSAGGVTAHAVLVNLDCSTGWFRVFAGCSTHIVLLNKRTAFLHPDTGEVVKGNKKPQCIFLRGANLEPYRKLGTIVEIK